MYYPIWLNKFHQYKDCFVNIKTILFKKVPSYIVNIKYKFLQLIEAISRFKHV